MSATTEMIDWLDAVCDGASEIGIRHGFGVEFPDGTPEDLAEAANLVRSRRADAAFRAVTSYPASQIKRVRATKAEVTARREALRALALELAPATVRQVFYQATVRGYVEKTESGYQKVQEDLVLLRRTGRLPYSALADNTRWQRKPDTYTNVETALREAAKHYRKDLWAEADRYVEVWLEKDALAGVIMPVTTAYDVPLMVARGYASLSFLHSAAEQIAELEVPTYVLHLGDFDPSGVNAGEKIEQTLREMAPSAEIHFKRLAVTPGQIKAWNLPTRPTKITDSRAKGFGDISVELDAIEPGLLRGLVEMAIREHMPSDYYDELMIAEEDERYQINAAVDALVVEGVI